MKERFAKHLEQNLPKVKSFHPFFNQALAAMFLAGGKHFRAQLLLCVVECKASELLDQALDVALAVEFIHTYSLIHDDLPAMDNADLRRGIPTLHKNYDEATAILVGDALNTQAFFLLSNLNLKPQIIVNLVRTLAYNAGLNGMVIGQALDCHFEKKKLDIDQIQFLHTHKTAKLIAASLKMGCELCEVEEKQSQALYNFGLKIGLLFQINDDINDATNIQAQSGKPTQHDVDKNSFVNLLGLEQAYEYKYNLFNECKENLYQFDEKLAKMIGDLLQQYL
ncbi:polyprenyl synthetase family protein [Campylobacter sp. MIT 21-1685]|uniref:polyprenyl synthetase family protein n=1 Tax=unclassified Campylobacter TaxID=2593542 RepID=UPI00224AF041|nr:MULTISPECIES: polyprenyl synthetase family protein [unclassified Campylobacter]MCX2683359.1 polyprenyl synthetase family protein [Campylobacter sp. MIT 21-1684]MCX2751586.1 polyprenyl synthetase family protein [Campylobacter sp. MIT 21-1682]MCX2807785.1 polyprenyl synthetase family protein [Campylobacter sp. MIT 21-1685]